MPTYGLLELLHFITWQCCTSVTRLNMTTGHRDPEHDEMNCDAKSNEIQCVDAIN